MKKLFTIVCIFISASSFAQCASIECSNPITLPLPSDQNAFNNLNNQNGSRCFNNPTGQTNTISNNFNFNGWEYLTFQDGAVTNVPQNINFGGISRKAYIYMPSGICNFNGNTSMNGGQSEPDTIYLLAGTLNINNCIANNYYNYVVMSPGTILKINGSFYTPGQTVQLQGNSTNSVHILACSGVPLGNVILRFTRINDVLKWKVESNERIEIQHSIDGKNFNYYASTYQKDGGMIISQKGYYRLKVGDILSTVEYFDPEQIIETKQKIYFYDGYWDMKKPVGRSYGYKVLR